VNIINQYKLLTFRKKLLILSIFTFLLFALAGLTIRNSLLNWYLNHKIESFQTRYHAQLSIGEAEFSGFNGIDFERITLIPQNGDTLAKIQSLKCTVKFLPLLLGKLKITSLQIDSCNIQLIRKDSTNDNYSFLLKKMNTTEIQEDTIEMPNYSERFDLLLETIFNKIPNSIKLTDFKIVTIQDSIKVTAVIDTFNIVAHQFKTLVKFDENGSKKELYFDGNINSDKRIAGFKLYSASGTKATFPYLKSSLNLKFEFDTLQFQLNENIYNQNLLTINGSTQVVGLVLNHSRIALKDVVLDKGSIDYRINIGQDFYELDSTSVFLYNKLNFNPYLKYLTRPSKQLTFKINKTGIEASDFFESLPKGLFTNIEGLQASGKLSYTLDFFVDFAQPDSLRFFSDMKRDHFRIVKFGATDLSKMSRDFVYTAYEKAVPVKTYTIGLSDPDFTCFPNIPQVLRNAVLTSEDGGFYNHRGFYLDAFAQSIALNIKQKRFARGGSTISMQLVKNVFLTRNKTIARKLEEILIVWLIENNGLCTKERMFEVYLNIIEWGPMIYGIGEASQFYFDKAPSKLTLSESIFLASIIPHPKWFMYSFDTNGHLRPTMEGYYKLVASKMLRKEFITQEQADRLVADVELKGSAKQFLKKNVVAIDTTEIKKDFELK